jgi:hypothetical protein
MTERVMIVTTVTPADADALLDAIATAGGGKVGHYTHCAFFASGEGRFRPDAAASPHIGTVGAINREPEIRIETFCPRSQARQVVAAIRHAHPYEEPVIYVLPVLDEADL